MNELRPLLYFILGLMVMFLLWFEISASNPCSVWSDRPSDCDMYVGMDYGKSST